MRGDAPISRIYRMGEPEDKRDPLVQWGRIEKMRRDAWRKCGVVALDPNELPENLARQVTEWAEENYGKRKAKAQRI